MRARMSIWFFAGVMLLAYGLVILAAGIWELSHPLPNPPALAHLHAPIWWGAMLAIAGAGYTLKFWPRR
jgi:sulfite exporter TauE/SafE